jgi:hypothetical protein
MTVVSTCIRLVVVYFPPPSDVNKSTVALFMSEFSTYLETLAISSGRLIITGDFNFHMESTSDPVSVRFKELLESASLSQHVTSPTHTSGHMLDLIMSRPSDKVVCSTSVSSLISDHHAIHSKLNINRPPLPRKTVNYRNLKKMNMVQFKNQMKDLKLLTNSSDDLGELYNMYNSELKELLDANAPLQTKTIITRPLSPWYNENIFQARKECKKAESTWRSTGLTVHREIYCHLRNKKKSLISTAKKDHFRVKIDDCGHDQRALFKVVDQLLGKTSDLKLPTHDSLEDLLERFSQFFS